MGNSLERKKKKGGKYSFFVANNDGEVVEKMDKKYQYGYVVGNLYALCYEEKAPVYKTQESVQYDDGGEGWAKEHKYWESHGGELVELIDLYDLEGVLAISGVEEIQRNIQDDLEKSKLILNFSNKFISKWIEIFKKTNQVPIHSYFEYGKTSIGCEINSFGGIRKWIKK